ncbi:R3H domain-containing protein 2-like [Punica granatum]|uniref:Uncharacterized protein n=2 Tax=Punica granatum TaxID=22663 RepID=A0A218WKC7_PUNGR|nr:R3H domain-containing protein 2-like [Punica granatum]OWM73096.1 hypothetical protein CDL15_Pgr001210 [Punica granatum]PKI63586.1 hypothetical protein CRG98_016030 [Punica granatum]
MDTASVVSDKESMVDPFLVEALQNPRHRLTILRMELDIRRFMQSTDQKIFEFQHFPTSYLRLAAHRVAQHYGLQTMVQDTSLDGTGNRILAIKTTESKFPAVRLSDIPAKQSENDKSEQLKVVIRARPSKSSGSEGNDSGVKRNSMRSMEERKEEYDKARARIFNSPTGSEADDMLSSASIERKNVPSGKDENEACRFSLVEAEKNVGIKEGSSSSRVAILKDREKDRTDPDYDRSYERYARNIPTQTFGLLPFNMQKIHHPFSHYDSGFAQLGQMPRAPASLSYIPPSSAVMSPFSTTGLSQGTSDAAYMQWPTASVMYAHSYEQFRHGVFQAPAYQQPLSFDYSQNH